MVQPTVKVAAVDIGTNSMRMLVRDGHREYRRRVEVTGLGKGVDASGRLSEAAIDRTVQVLADFGAEMGEIGVDRRRAIATSATRDAQNRHDFLNRAANALGVEPEVISGDEEAGFAYSGATSWLGPGSWVVSDIGGGSTEFVTSESSVSIDIGSVRLTDRILSERPARPNLVAEAGRHVLELFSSIEHVGDLVGVAGTWTSLSAIASGLGEYDSRRVHGHRLDRASVDRLVAHLGSLTLEETAAIASLNPKRAAVILSGAVIARCVMEVVDATTAIISEKDSLDGLASAMLGLP